MATVHPSRMRLVPQAPSDIRRGRSPSPRSHSRDRNVPSSSRRSERRASPAYEDYRRPPPPPPSEPTAPWRQPENMYPNRRGDVNHQGFHNVNKGGQGGGSDFMEKYVISSRYFTILNHHVADVYSAKGTRLMYGRRHPKPRRVLCTLLPSFHSLLANLR
ncbi:hypothetical protein CPB85DRAFT_413613 [Mucidula mucida]|nr:hypothetical protein CPB85DRAFT_413613 [Mucidula mucida]